MGNKIKNRIKQDKATLRQIKHPNFKTVVKGGVGILIIAVIAAALITVFDLGITELVNLIL